LKLTSLESIIPSLRFGYPAFLDFRIQNNRLYLLLSSSFCHFGRVSSALLAVIESHISSMKRSFSDSANPSI